jgi:hypothetical protein
MFTVNNAVASEQSENRAYITIVTIAEIKYNATVEPIKIPAQRRSPVSRHLGTLQNKEKKNKDKEKKIEQKNEYCREKKENRKMKKKK